MALGDTLTVKCIGIDGQGTDLAIVTFGNGVYLSHQALAEIDAVGTKTRIIDTRWLSRRESLLPRTSGLSSFSREGLVVDAPRFS